MKKLFIACMMLCFLPCMTVAGTLPDTGQTKCYDNTQEIPCPNPGEPFYGQDAQYGPNLQSYTKLDENGNDLPDEATEWVMVRDNVTGLIWEMKTDDSSIHDKDNNYTWERAMEFGTTLNTRQVGGCADWRLPVIKELMSIVDRDRCNPSISVTYFPYTVAYDYWSSTTHAGNPNFAWCAYFDDGGGMGYYKFYGYISVRAVRGAQWGSNNYIDNGNNTVTDTDTGLMWQKDAASDTYNWEEALSYCEDLELAGYNDWRLPNINELQSIVDYNRHIPSLDPFFLLVAPNYWYWSSTTIVSSPQYAWFINFGDGYVGNLDKLYHAYTSLRAVRGGQCGLLGDADNDTVCNDVDNCVDHYNPFQEDSYPPQGNGIGDACDCEGNFNCSEDRDVDGTDAANFKIDFGRSTYSNPCTTENPCQGNFNCDRDCDGTDAAIFKQDFGRSTFSNPCPVCTSREVWCPSCLPFGAECTYDAVCCDGCCCTLHFAGYCTVDEYSCFLGGCRPY